MLEATVEEIEFALLLADTGLTAPQIADETGLPLALVVEILYGE